MISAAYLMNRSASLLNDTNRTLFTYAAQIPYLNTAIQELREEMELNNVPYSNATTPVEILLEANVDNIGGDGGPALPVGLKEIRQLWQRPSGTGNPYLPIQHYEYLPEYWTGTTQRTDYIPAWTWQEQIVKFIPSNLDTDIKFDYIKNNLPDIVDENTIITLINCENVLSFRNAGLCARFIGENPTRADSLDTMAILARDRFLGISSKGKQNINTRRRPFRAAYRNRGSW